MQLTNFSQNYPKFINISKKKQKIPIKTNNQRLPGKNTKVLSGKPLFIKSTLMLKKMYVLTNGQIPLIGVGGISNAQECYQKIKSGASLIQLYTVLTLKGPKILETILIDLINLLKTDGYKNIKEAIGKEL